MGGLGFTSLMCFFIRFQRSHAIRQPCPRQADGIEIPPKAYEDAAAFFGRGLGKFRV